MDLLSIISRENFRAIFFQKIEENDFFTVTVIIFLTVKVTVMKFFFVFSGDGIFFFH